MNNAEVLKSYLVSLGFVVDQPQAHKFDAALKTAEGAVEKHTSGIVKNMLAWQTAIVGAFTTVAGATIGLMDKVAQADQEYRLFGLHMFMNANAAKTLKVATDALGASLDDIAWDPELHARFMQLVDDQKTLQGSLGADFEKQMVGIRNVRFEFTRLQVEMQYLAMGVASSLFNSLGGEGLIEKLQKLNDWIEANLPKIVQFITKNIVPIFKEWETIAKDLAGLLEGIGVTFSNLIGLFSGDDSIEGTQFSFEKLAGAIQHVAHWMSEFVGWITLAERMVLHFVNGALLALTGHFGEAAEEFKKGLGDITAGSASIIGMLGGNVAGGMYGSSLGAEIGAGIGSLLGPEGTVIGGAIGGVVGLAAGGFVGGAAGAGVGAAAGAAKQAMFPSEADHGFYNPLPQQPSSRSDIDPLVESTAKHLNVDPNLARAVAQQESGERQYDSRGNVVTSKAGAMGVMQLMPDTAKTLSVDPRDTQQNIEGGISYLAQLLDKYSNNVTLALAAYNWGPGNVDKAIAHHKSFQDYPAETQAYVKNIERQLPDIQVGSIEVNVTHPGATHDEVQHAVRTGVQDALNRQTQLNLAQLSGVYPNG